MKERQKEVAENVKKMDLNSEMSREEKAHLLVAIGKMVQSLEEFKKGLPKE